METAVVTKKAGAEVDRKDSGDDLRHKKSDNNGVEGGALEIELTVKNTAGSPEGEYSQGGGIHKDHFGILKQFGVVGDPYEGCGDDDKEK